MDILRKKKKTPVQRVQINLYKQQSPVRVKNYSNAISRGALSSKSAQPSPLATPGNRTPMRIPSYYKLQPQMTQRDVQHTLQQSIQNSLQKQYQALKQSGKSVAKFHSRQSSINRTPITDRNRSISPAQIYGQQLKSRILVQQKEKPKKPRPTSRSKINTEMYKIPSLQYFQQLKSQKSSNKFASNQNSAAISRVQSPKLSVVPSPEQNTTEETKSYDEEKKQIIQYLKQYFDKSKTMPITTPQFYNFIKLIGKGGFAKVALAKHKLTGMEVAIKTINKKKIRDENHKRRIMQEAQMLKRMNHENIVKCYEIFETQKYVMIVMEHCQGGSLNKLLKVASSLSEDQCHHIFKQIVKAVHCVHFNRILHRDIKPGNILMVQEMPEDLRNYYPDIKLCDFGTSTYVNYGETIHRQCGTPSYIAPEIAADNGYEGFNSDI